jgi:Ni,Fe-hydrogenase I cytochrome b subunit
MATTVNVRKQSVAEVAAPLTLAYEHPWVVRFAHWVNAVAVLVLVGTGLQIFRA